MPQLQVNDQVANRLRANISEFVCRGGRHDSIFDANVADVVFFARRLDSGCSKRFTHVAEFFVAAFQKHRHRQCVQLFEIAN